MKRYLSFLLLSLIASQAFAQIFPVRTITTVAPPYPTSLEQFANIDNGRISLTIIPNDVSLHNYPVKLRLVISGAGYQIYTDPNFVHKSIVLNNGEPQVFTGPELAEWFNPDHLIFEGMSKNQYLKTGLLPEGICQVWFETYDYYRNFNISSTSKAMIWMVVNNPPLLNFPANTTELPAVDPQNVIFNWTQQQSPFSGSGSLNQYQFELWEVWPDALNAEDVVRTTRPLYTTQVTSTTFAYTAEAPILVVGRRYAWRIQVSDPSGRNRYNNDGYSEVRWFRFGKICGVPQPVADKATSSSLSVKWESDYTIDKYEIRYRNKNSKDANWYTKDATGLGASIDGLQANCEYEIQMHGFCGGQEGNYSASLTMRTKQETASTCGGAAGNADLTNKDPLPALKPGDFIHASDFDVQVYQVTGANGTFSGKAMVMVPLLKFVKFDATFSGIQVNTDYRMTSGTINFVYDAKNGMVLNVGALLDSLLKKDPATPIENNPYNQAADNTTTVNTDISDISVNTNTGDVVIHTTDGNTLAPVRSTPGNMVAVEGSTPASEQYVADTKTGTVYSAKPETNGSSGGQSKPVQPASSTTPAKYTVTFAKHPAQNYGIDIFDDKALENNYNKTTIGGQDYLIPWKSVETNKMDRVLANVSGGPADSIHFITGSNNMVMTAPGSGSNAQTSKQLLVTGMEESDEFKAWYSEYVKKDTVMVQNRVLAGQVNVAAYDKILREVNVVEVNDAYAPDAAPIEKQLNSIYASAVVQWKVTKITGFNPTLTTIQNNQFDSKHPGSKNFNANETEVVDSFISQNNFNPSSFYLFFIKGATTDNTKLGYMPFNQNFGFIFHDNQNPDELIRTIAHELGHGAYCLRHVFSPKCMYHQTKGQTNNLMDYVDASKATTAIGLYKYQWDGIQVAYNDSILGSWTEGGAEAENVDESCFSKLIYRATFNSIIAIQLKDLDLFQKIYSEIHASEYTYCIGDMDLNTVQNTNYSTQWTGAQTTPLSLKITKKHNGTIKFNTITKYCGVTGLSPITIFHELTHAGQFIFDIKSNPQNYQVGIARAEVEVRVIILFNYYKNVSVALRHDYNSFHNYMKILFQPENDYEPFFGIFPYNSITKGSYNFNNASYEKLNSEDFYNIVSSYFDYILHVNTDKNYDPSTFRSFLQEYSKCLYDCIGYKNVEGVTRADFYNYDGTTPYFNHLTP